MFQKSIINRIMLSKKVTNLQMKNFYFKRFKTQIMIESFVAFGQIKSIKMNSFKHIIIFLSKLPKELIIELSNS
jgi:hypothetical protein